MTEKIIKIKEKKRYLEDCIIELQSCWVSGKDLKDNLKYFEALLLANRFGCVQVITKNKKRYTGCISLAPIVNDNYYSIDAAAIVLHDDSFGQEQNIEIKRNNKIKNKNIKTVFLSKEYYLYKDLLSHLQENWIRGSDLLRNILRNRDYYRVLLVANNFDCVQYLTKEGNWEIVPKADKELLGFLEENIIRVDPDVVFSLIEYKADDSYCECCEFSGGDGTKENPYLISTIDDLKNIGKVETTGKYFIQTEEIDCSKMSFNIKFSGGKGTKNDPYLISTLDDLRNISYLKNVNNCEKQYFSIINNIDCSELAEGEAVIKGKISCPIEIDGNSKKIFLSSLCFMDTLNKNSYIHNIEMHLPEKE